MLPTPAGALLQNQKKNHTRGPGLSDCRVVQETRFFGIGAIEDSVGQHGCRFLVSARVSALQKRTFALRSREIPESRVIVSVSLRRRGIVGSSTPPRSGACFGVVDSLDMKRACSQPSHHAREVDLPRMLDPEYWQKLCPELHVADRDWQLNVTPMIAAEGVISDARAAIRRDGFTKIPAACLPWSSVNHRALAVAATRLVRHGWNPTWLLMFDEGWAIAHELTEIVERATGNNLSFDVLSWHVDPADVETTAFSPHRDRQPDDSAATFRVDGTAMYATAWIALTDSTPENSCLCFIPRYQDPGYSIGDNDDPGESDADPLRLCLPNKEAFQHVTPVPAEAGSAVIFTHRVIHWGSRGRGRPESYGLPRVEPRVCISFGFADDAFEPAYMSRCKNLPFPPLSQRVALVASQMIAYHERFPLNARELKIFHDAISTNAAELDPLYRKKVMDEYVRATSATIGGADRKYVGEDKSERQTSATYDDDDDAILERALDAKIKGVGDDFEDDFDEWEDGVQSEDDNSKNQTALLNKRKKMNEARTH